MPRLQSCSFEYLVQCLVGRISLLTVPLILALPIACAAQHRPLASADLDTKLVKLNVKSVTLEAMVALLAKQMNCDIIMDDSPHHEPIDFSMEITARKALDRIAAAYDYEWRLSKQGVLLLSKRFADPAEFPQMNPAEWKQTSKDVQQILGQHDFTSDSRALRAFVTSLTSEQARDIRAGKHFFVSALNEPQIATLREYFYVRLLMPTAFAWNQIADNLTMLTRSAIQMQIADDFLDTYVSKKEHRPQRTALSLVIHGKNKDGSRFSIPLYTQDSIMSEPTIKIEAGTK